MFLKCQVGTLKNTPFGNEKEKYKKSIQKNS